MKTFVRLIRRYVLAAGVVLLVVGLLLRAGGLSGPAEELPPRRIGTLARSLTPTADGLPLAQNAPRRSG